MLLRWQALPQGQQGASHQPHVGVEHILQFTSMVLKRWSKLQVPRSIKYTNTSPSGVQGNSACIQWLSNLCSCTMLPWSFWFIPLHPIRNTSQHGTLTTLPQPQRIAVLFITQTSLHPFFSTCTSRSLEKAAKNHSHAGYSLPSSRGEKMKAYTTRFKNRFFPAVKTLNGPQMLRMNCWPTNLPLCSPCTCLNLHFL